MMSDIVKILLHAIMITGFVFIMMLIIEYINVQTKGLWQKKLSQKPWHQYLIAGVLGAIPGCLGAFTIVAMYSHRLVSFGALVTVMIATSGDEAFVMFSMFPYKASLLTIIILIIGIFSGYLTDKFYQPKKSLEKLSHQKLPLHKEDKCSCFEKHNILKQLINPSAARLSIALVISIIILAILLGALAGKMDVWLKTTVLIAFSFSLFISLTVPNHFLKEHIWNHIVKKHLPRIFLWVFGTLIFMHVLMTFINLEDWISNNLLIVLVVSVLLGFIPESGPHMIFVTLFAQGSIPFSILLASSISQDGHAGLPLLAESKRSFLALKIINIIVALMVGFLGFGLGF
jgi:hypothetical protein